MLSACLIPPLLGYAVRRHMLSNIKHLGEGLVTHTMRRKNIYNHGMVMTNYGPLFVMGSNPEVNKYTIDIGQGLKSHQAIIDGVMDKEDFKIELPICQNADRYIVDCYSGKLNTMVDVYISGDESKIHYASDNEQNLRSMISFNVIGHTLIWTALVGCVVWILEH